jgi:uncharacterized protein YbjT (DUF2867 family)
MKALLFGGTGLIGSHLLNQLIVSQSFSSITSFVRKESNPSSLKVKEIKTDFQNLYSLKDEFSSDVCFISLGTTINKAGSQEKFKEVDYVYVLNIAKICREMDVKTLLIVSSLGADPNSSVFYSKVKGEMERDTSQLGFQSLYFFRPSLLLGERTEFRFGEKAGEWVSELFSFAFVGGWKKFKPISAELVAKSMLKTSLAPKTGVYILESDEISS